jgi:hypothetical protein
MYYDYYFYLNNFFILTDRVNTYNFNHFFLKTFKNFFNAVNVLLNCNYRFLSFDVSSRNLIFKNLFFHDAELLQYNFFFHNFLKVLKNQSFLHFYKFFFKKNNIKFVLIFDYEYYFNFLSYINLLNVSIFSLIPYYNPSQYSDFFLLFDKKNSIFYKTVCYSYILYIINNVYEHQKNLYKFKFFKNLISYN